MVIGLDVGTTATKVVAFEVGSPWRHVELREYPMLAPVPGWQVQDPAAIRDAVMAALTECVAAAGAARVIALSVSTAMHGLVGLDEGHRPLTPLVTWADARSREEARHLRDGGLADLLYRACGTPIHPMTPLTKIMWFTRHEPELAARVRWWAGLKDFVLCFLTSKIATELSSASGTAMLDLTTGDWNPMAVDLAGIRVEQLPPVLATTHTLGLSAAAAAAVGLPSGVPVVVGAGDGPLGNLATGAMSPGTVGLSLGTSGAARMVVPEPVLDPQGRLFCYALTHTQWVLGGAVSNGGIVVRWAGEVFGISWLGGGARAPTPSCWRWPTPSRRVVTGWSCCPTCSPSGRRCGTPTSRGPTWASGAADPVPVRASGVCCVTSACLFADGGPVLTAAAVVSMLRDLLSDPNELGRRRMPYTPPKFAHSFTPPQSLPPRR